MSIHLKIVGNPQSVLIRSRILPFKDFDINLCVVSEFASEELKNSSIKQEPLGFSIGSGAEGGNVLQRILAAIRHLKSIPHDVTHIHFAKGNLNWLAAIVSLKPYLVSTMGSDINLVDGTRQMSFLEKKIVRSFLRGASLVTTKSEEMAKRLRKMGVSEKRIKLLPWGIDRSLFDQAQPQKVYEMLNLTNDRQIILSIRSCKPFYQIIDLVNSFARLHKQFPKTYFVILSGFGSTDYQIDIQSRIDELSLSQHISLVPTLTQQELANFYTAAICCWSNSQDDGLPQSFIESMYCQTPVIANSLDVYKGVFPEGRGILYTNNSAEKFDDQTAKLLEDQNVLNDLNEKSRRHANTFPNLKEDAGSLYKMILALPKGYKTSLLKVILHRCYLAGLYTLYIISGFLSARFSSFDRPLNR